MREETPDARGNAKTFISLGQPAHRPSPAVSPTRMVPSRSPTLLTAFILLTQNPNPLHPPPSHLHLRPSNLHPIHLRSISRAHLSRFFPLHPLASRSPQRLHRPSRRTWRPSTLDAHPLRGLHPRSLSLPRRRQPRLLLWYRAGENGALCFLELDAATGADAAPPAASGISWGGAGDGGAADSELGAAGRHSPAGRRARGAAALLHRRRPRLRYLRAAVRARAAGGERERP